MELRREVRELVRLTFSIAALAAALEDGIEHMEENAKKTIALRDRLIKGLSDIPYSQLNGDPVKRLPGNVNYSFEGVGGRVAAIGS